MDISNLPPTTPHLNVFGLQIKATPATGRGVYASRHIPKGTLIEVSPVLLFSQQEYEAYGKHTILDSYVFHWRRMNAWALALGLGSLFNHSQTPNITFSLDYGTMSIRYTTSRALAPGDELCICYGREEDMWWNSSERPVVSQSSTPPSDPFEGLDLDTE
ncbi:uncharacterized protein EI90DRAFT_3001764 [Cantharellus anzutake]|uniref:uncharacterized protein n=1 Tax=Cantharellus anzutake TaxID=1750568 RepID=UPI00190623F2|nr:uncharacterized protein EI90DRAFT_3001764 [Cantharellus anzutake]KAF8320630.1 hypothetical protein EI90DRAFT_3001764 [Cantharellus anzutake]